MNEFGPYFGNSEIGYDAMRRRRRWAANRGMQGYAAYLLGVGDDSQTADLVAAETAAFSDNGSSVLRPVLIGVATGALTFLVNRWLGKVFK